MKPRRTLSSVRAKLEAIGEQRHRETVDRLAGPVRRFACELHQWHPPAGPGTRNMDALASLCPSCAAERRQREREAAEPEVHHLDVYGGSEYQKKLWAAACDRREQQGHILGGSAAEREIVRHIDEARREELYELGLTAEDRRRALRSRWEKRLRLAGRT